MLRISILLNILVLCHISLQAQLETRHWIFGDSAFVSFDNKGIIANNTINFNSFEACSSLSDSAGNLLYYYNGKSIYNHLGQMIHSTKGNPSTHQGALILKHPHNLSDVFFFSSDDISTYDSAKLYHHQLGKNGNMVFKNKILYTGVSEQLAAINHQNNCDIWLVTHSALTDTFLFYLLQKEGLLCCPKIQKQGYYLDNNNQYPPGQTISISPNGKYLVQVAFSNFFDLFQFNTEKGELEKKYFHFGYYQPRDALFNRKSDKLYITFGEIFQYNISKFDPDSISQSARQVFEGSRSHGQLQHAIDGKIYVANRDSSFLGINHHQDSLGEKAGFVYRGPSIKGKSQQTLPNFNQSYFYTPAIDFKYQQTCTDNSIQFYAKDTFASQSQEWKITKGNTTYNYIGKNAKHSFSDTGRWQVSYIARNNSINRHDSVIKTIHIYPKINPQFLGKDINYCNISPLPRVLKAPAQLHCLHWYYKPIFGDSFIELKHSQSNDDTLLANKQGYYIAKATNQSFCVIYDTIKFENSVPRAYSLLINGNSNLIQSTDTHLRYQWYINEVATYNTTHSIIPRKKGLYRLHALSKYGCWAFSHGLLIDSILSTNSKPKANYKLFPNPNHGVFSIQLLQQGTYHIKISNSIGQMILETTTSTHSNPSKIEIDLRSFSKGIYNIEIKQDIHSWHDKVVME